MSYILIIDDEPANRELLTTLLGYDGYTVVAACDGAEGLALALAERPDLVITDILMPEMDGYEFTRRVRSIPALAQTRVLFYTATYLVDDVRALAAECGVSHILTKPAAPEMILDVVRTVLSITPPTAYPSSGGEADREYMRLLTNTLHRKVEELKAEVQAREQAESALHQANADLDRRVQERTAELTAANQRLHDALAAQAAVAAQNEHIFEALRQSHERLQTLSQRLVAVQEAERRHIARELHDEIGQALTGLRLTLELVSRLPADDRAARVAEAHEAVQELIGRVRSLSLDLRPAMLDDMGLLPALLWHFRRYTEQTGIAVDCKHRGLDGRLPVEVETVAYRVVQEALTNVARHAGVGTVDVRLLATREQISVRVADTGRGFDLAAAPDSPRSSGLLGMQERVSLIGGSLSITSSIGTGTQVLADLPLRAEGGEEEEDDYDRARRRSPDRSPGAAGAAGG
jgi:signal transduction histidine kinase